MLREYGAHCITSAQDVREMLGLVVGGGGSGARSGRTDDATRVQDALSTTRWRDSLDVARRAGMAPDDVEALLGLLHLEGAVVRASAGWRLVGGARR